MQIFRLYSIAFGTLSLYPFNQLNPVCSIQTKPIYVQKNLPKFK